MPPAAAGNPRALYAVRVAPRIAIVPQHAETLSRHTSLTRAQDAARRHRDDWYAFWADELPWFVWRVIDTRDYTIVFEIY